MGTLETVRATMELVQQSDLGRRSLAEVENVTFEIIPDDRQSIFLTITKGATEVGTQRPAIDHPDKLIPIRGPEQAIIDVFEGRIRVADAVFTRDLIAPVYGKYSYLLALLAKLIRVARKSPNFRHKY